jgi:hypothetical protein
MIIFDFFFFLLIGDYGISRSMGITTTVAAGTTYEININSCIFLFIFFFFFFF